MGPILPTYRWQTHAPSECSTSTAPAGSAKGTAEPPKHSVPHGADGDAQLGLSRGCQRMAVRAGGLAGHANELRDDGAAKVRR